MKKNKLLTIILLSVLLCSLFGNLIQPAPASIALEDTVQLHAQAIGGFGIPITLIAQGYGYVYEEFHDGNYEQYLLFQGAWLLTPSWDVGIVTLTIGKEFEIIDSDIEFTGLHQVAWHPLGLQMPVLLGEGSSAWIGIPYVGTDDFYVLCKRVDYTSDECWVELSVVLTPPNMEPDLDIDFARLALPPKPNLPPNVPELYGPYLYIDGDYVLQSVIYPDTDYIFGAYASDPNDDDVRYVFDWGDGTTTTTYWYSGGYHPLVTHSWSSSSVGQCTCDYCGAGFSSVPSYCPYCANSYTKVYVTQCVTCGRYWFHTSPHGYWTQPCPYCGGHVFTTLATFYVCNYCGAWHQEWHGCPHSSFTGTYTVKVKAYDPAGLWSESQPLTGNIKVTG